MVQALAVAAIALLASVGPLRAAGPSTLPSSVHLEQWETQPDGGWITGALQQNNSDYMEGEAVPFRLEIPSKIDAGVYQFSVCRNYEDGARRGYLFIAAYNTDRPATPGGTIGSSVDGFSAVNATIDAVADSGAQGGCKAGDREVVVTITKQTGDAYVLWGGHLAAPLDPGVGAGNGAASWPGASLHMKLSEPSKDLPINTCEPQTTPTAAITATSTLPPHTATVLATSTSTVAPTHTNTPASSVTVPPATGTPPVATTDTPVPPTDTPVPPTDTDTPVPPTNTPLLPTNTPAPSATVPTASETPVPPGTATATGTVSAIATLTPIPSTSTPAPTETPAAATAAARAAATATAISSVAGELRPRQVPNTGCAVPSSDSGTPWALILIAALGGAAIATVVAGFAVKKSRP
jgi:hypothetical protein